MVPASAGAGGQVGRGRRGPLLTCAARIASVISIEQGDAYQIVSKTFTSYVASHARLRRIVLFNSLVMR